MYQKLRLLGNQWSSVNVRREDDVGIGAESGEVTGPSPSQAVETVEIEEYPVTLQQSAGTVRQLN